MSQKIISLVLAGVCSLSQAAFGQTEPEALQLEVVQIGALQAPAPQAEAVPAGTQQAEGPQREAPAPAPAPTAAPVVKVEQSYWAAEGLSARMRKARAITLYLMDPAVVSLRAVDEAQLKDTGCEYRTEDAALIASFADAVEATSVRSNSFTLQFEPREAVYLALGDSGLKLLFEKPYPNQAELLGQINGQPVTASKGLVEALYRWAARLPRVRKCEAFVGRYR
ncbi:hypothetical protein [Ralstonia mannitolilytica]|uniref:Uncharacterized protein n=1 Tax=Ralstonia mannitolilytica TaxID=105219 RepID=A0AAJ4ZNE1_9RALS|nr:hypothetical protein [Ralstonia mannitolilytica]CAG2130852.1 hypothetical protein LMG6866_00468 [Ralstonia mannitolilytica]CAJ0736306.1 hypothetical protein R77592_04008 [Ralstonia mannitolilytica]SUE24717.1 Uncharacterised protein [Ralstonia mannitolilytica]SUE25377.1 Uncharacterised protein [Ralstonia mannitolilytica]SUE35187.1 Uncharacterised protein [Ralstonia mannitolilytica]